MTGTMVCGIITHDGEELKEWVRRKLENGYVVWHMPGSDSAIVLGRIENKDEENDEQWEMNGGD
ncbi:MAG: hypothetical protein QW292_09095 [Candidatus Parvarchaeota archaeon]